MIIATHNNCDRFAESTGFLTMLITATTISIRSKFKIQFSYHLIFNSFHFMAAGTVHPSPANNIVLDEETGIT